MPPILSNKELQIASWLYERRPLFNRMAYIGFFCVSALLAILILINGILVLQNIILPQKVKLLEKTQSLVISPDPSLMLAPRPLAAQQTFAVNHPGRGEDFFATVINPNLSWAAFSFNYSFTSGGNSVSGTRASYAFPGENSIVSFSSLPLPIPSIEVRFEDIRWMKLVSRRDKDRLKLFSVTTYDAVFIKGDKQESIDLVRAHIINNTAFSFWSVPVIALVYTDGAIKAVGEGSIDRFLAGEDRELEIGLGITDIEKASIIQLIPRVNVLDGSALITS